MNPLKQYNIGFVGLSNGKHSFSFEVSEEFFACFEESEITKGKVHLELNLEKSSSMLVWDFNFKGYVESVCDRCMDSFSLPVDSHRRLFVKFGETYSEQSDEIVVISETESHFDVSQYVYEFLHLSLPIKRVHAEDASGKPACDPEQIKKLEEYLLDKNKKKSGDAGQSPWEVLKSLKLDENN